MTFEVKLLITFVVTDPLVIVTKFGRNPIKHVGEEANCEKEERKKERTRNCALAKGAREVRRYVKCKLYKHPIRHYGLAYEQIIQWDAPFNFVSHQLLALLDLMWSHIQQLAMLNLMYYKSGIKIKI